MSSPAWPRGRTSAACCLQNVSETLTELNSSNGSLMPRLAESWEQTGDATWRFHLRQGVKFSDGTDFDAGDVKHSFERVLSDKISCEIGAKYFGGMTITPTVVDDVTIDITSDPAQPILPLADVDADHRAGRDADRIHPPSGRHRPL